MQSAFAADMHAIWQDVRYGARMLARQRSFTAIALLTLALGVGANTVIFSLLRTLYWRPLPVPHPAGLVHVFGAREGRTQNLPISFVDFESYRDRTTAFSALAAHYASAPINFADAGESHEINGSVVTANYFALLELTPSRGRFFRDDEDRVPGRDAVAVISDRFWTRQFDRDPAVIGRALRLNGTRFVIIGVAPRGFEGVRLGGLAVDVWMPSAMFGVGYRYCDALHDPDCRTVTLLGRLAKGRTVADAGTELQAAARRIAAASPATNAGWSVTVLPAQGASINTANHSDRTPLVLAAGVGLVLLIACANIAGLLLARGLNRRHELTVRAAIGATRGRLVQQLLTENFLLALAGGIGGLIVATWAKDLLLAFYTLNDEGQRTYFTLDLDALAFVFTLAISSTAGVLFGAVAAVHGGRVALHPDLRGQTTSGRASSRLRDTLVVAQVALSLVLAAGAGLLLRSVHHIYEGPGYDPTHVALFRLRPSLIDQSPQQASAYQQRVIDALQSSPGVLSASPATFLPLPGWDDNTKPVWLPSEAPASREAAFRASWNRVGPRYFETLGIPLIAGREFDARDRLGAPEVAIVNDVFARRFFASEPALGKTIVVDGRAGTIVGVVSSAQYLATGDAPRAFVYLSFWQTPDQERRAIDSRTHVRVSGHAEQALPALRRVLAGVNADVPISEDRALTTWLDYTFQPVRVAGTLFVWFGTLAVFLSAVGLYGVLAVMVTQRTRELAIRMALGATRQALTGLVIRHGFRLAALGVGLGMVLALASVRLLTSMLYGVRWFDPLTLAGVLLVMTAAVALAMAIPTRRAIRIDPLAALRAE
jgi:predicted permease